ncbi:hypothetical protein [Synechococcus sp. BS55D]|nr:hypothetical protein [Synechococcus sp. BS55D]
MRIGGVHEDFYDPGFCINNDVVVIDGGQEFFSPDAKQSLSDF